LQRIGEAVSGVTVEGELVREVLVRDD
jgi:hypothetical protein